MAFTDVFARKEMKYRLNAQQYNELLALMRVKMQPAEYAQGQVTSLYYDTPYFGLIERSLEKPLYKEKLRVRVYGNDYSAETLAFIELKKKYKGIVYKRRVAVSLAAAQAFLSGQEYVEACKRYPLSDAAAQERSLDKHSLQIAHEIACFLERYETLIPAMLISCDRMSFMQEDDRADAAHVQDDHRGREAYTQDLRITFDTNLMAVPFPASFEEAASIPFDERTPIIPEDEALMEVKCTGALPFWLVDALDRTCSYKQSFSKYGTAYTQMMRKGA